MSIAEYKKSCSQRVALWLVGGIKLLRLSQVTIHHNHLLACLIIIVIIFINWLNCKQYLLSIHQITNCIHIQIYLLLLLLAYFAIAHNARRVKRERECKLVERMFKATTPRRIFGQHQYTRNCFKFRSLAFPVIIIFLIIRGVTNGGCKQLHLLANCFSNTTSSKEDTHKQM